MVFNSRNELLLGLYVIWVFLKYNWYHNQGSIYVFSYYKYRITKLIHEQYPIIDVLMITKKISNLSTSLVFKCVEYKS